MITVRTYVGTYDGQGHGQLALPSRGSKQVLIEDGTKLWHYGSFFLPKIG